MEEWKTYTINKPQVRLNDLISGYIIKEMACLLPVFFSFDTKCRPQRTKLIKESLTNLGDRKLKGKPTYKVYSHGLSEHLRQSHGGKYKNTEWLYDLHWYTETNEPYIPTGLPLVVECEWNPRKRGEKTKVRYSGIKYDFQKLLVSNADLRLMIFIIKADKDIYELNEYFEKAINSYGNLHVGAKFLFVAFDEKIRSFHYAAKWKTK